MLDFWTTLGLIAATLTLAYFYAVRKNDFWAKRGIPFIKPVPFFGNMTNTVLKRKSIADVFTDNYKQLKPYGFGGIYEFMKPTLIVTSPELIRDMTVKNFDFFHDRRIIVTKETDPLFARSLPGLKGDEWREMRNKLSPAFTASKLKLMFPHISKCASQFAKFLITREEANTQPIEFKSTFTRMTNDVIATTAFGIETNAVQNPEEKFYKNAQIMTDFGAVRSLIALGFVVFPKLMAALGFSFTPKEVTNYFQQLIKGAMEYREKKNITRPDMLQLLMAAQKGKLKNEADEDVGTVGEDVADSELHKKHMATKKGDSMNITDEDIAAQAFAFFFAGYDTVATVLAFLAHELADNPEVQERLCEEVDATIQEGPLSYESVMGMKYLDMVISEALRKHPPAVGTDRTCIKNYKIPGTDHVIEAGMIITVPIYPLHRDPEYFPDPEKFDPERFSEENKADIKPYTYLPFGVGPHNCIGMRFALLEVKLCVIHLLATCKLRVCSKTEIPLQLSKKSLTMTTDNGFWLLAIPRENPSLEDNYKHLKPNGFGGALEFMQPIFMVTSPELIRDITSRPDMLQLLMAAQKGGITREKNDEIDSRTMGEDDIAETERIKVFSSARLDDGKRNITDEDIAAQAFIFFLAGYDTVSAVLSFTAHLLACNPEVQRKLFEEISSELESGNATDYDTIRSMKYLDMVISESLRLYPPAVFSDRKCTKNYKFPNSDFVMEAGQGIVYPIFALHRYPELFENPEIFDPERFNDENKKKIRPYTYLPFGSGPHNCIGMRFALLEAKVCLVHLSKKFELEVCDKTELPLKISTKTFQMTTDNGFWLRLRARKMLDFWTTLGLIAATLTLAYFYAVRNYDYWAKRGIPFIKPVPFFGSMINTVLKTKAFADVFVDNYKQLKPNGFGGIYEFMQPTLVVTSPELIRDMTVKNFDFFHDRRIIVSKDTDPLFARSLPGLKGDEWREMRNKLSPAFTASKLKLMFPHISKCASQFAKFLITREGAKTQPIEFKSTFTRMTNDVIATTAFGVETNAVQNPEEKFYKYAQIMTDFGAVRSLIALGFMVFPKLMAALGLSFTPKDVTNYFQQLIKGAMEYREKKNISRPDMLQLLMAAQKGKLKNEADEDVGTVGEDVADSELHKKHMATKKGDSIKITDEDIAAQAFIFFFAGYETVATVLAFLAHELAENPEVQERLREEVDATIQEGPLSYESVVGMKYLDMVISETLRKYPPAVGTDRTCIKNYKIPGTEHVIEAGMILSVPIYPLHRDPEYFPEPEKFDPERFSEENKADIKPYTYLPFGVGPHNCIGMRFALLEVKLCVIHLLATCKLRVCTKTEIPLQLSKKSFAMTTDNGFWLLAIPRENPTLKV
ncbi:uncharacterized protein LOC135941346 [Cloeon dipterum]|uniref:uncharacterized protein LOC135941346 n=1 Tax=Cloeon dipterum TaxID=197152 RepID=UPI003220432E